MTVARSDRWQSGFVMSGLVALAQMAFAGAGAAQTASTIGLGYPVLPIDGRAAALGATGLGLMGSSFSLINPADMNQHDDPGFALAFATEGIKLKGLDQGDVNSDRHRFNLIRAVAPFGNWRLGIAFGGAFDQDWAVRFRDSLVLQDGTVPFEETREHDGGISTIDLSGARSVGPVSVGFSAQRFTGSLRQTFNRTFEFPSGDAPTLGAAGGTQTLAYSGWRFRGGAALEVDDRFMLSGVVSLKSTLTATPDNEESPGEVEFPATFFFGGSFRPVSQLMVAGTYGWGAWSSAGDVNGSTSHDVSMFGAGLEYDGLTVLGGDMPLRLGIRRSELPFSNGDRPITERAITGGFGWVFRDGVAEINLGFDWGSRGDFAIDGVEESFRRMTMSFALRQISFF